MRIKISFGQLLDRRMADGVVITPPLLVDRLHLALEHPEDGIQEAFAVELRPMRQVLRRERIEIEGIIIRGHGVHLRPAERGDHLVELVRDDILRRLGAQLVDDSQQAGPLLGVVGHRQRLVFPENHVEDRLLCRIVDRPDLVGPLEHHVLEVMRDPGVRRLFCACLNDDRPHDLGLAMILIQPNRQAIIQLNYLDIQGPRSDVQSLGLINLIWKRRIHSLFLDC